MKQKPKTNPGKNYREEILVFVEDELEGVIALYEQLVEQSDKLATVMCYKEDYVLGKVMPKTCNERRDSKRIREWFDEMRNDVLDHLEQVQAAKLKREKREKLLADLNLTEEQKDILFGG